MPEILLRTKLFIPPVLPNLVPRPQLIDRLNKGLQLGHKLTLVSAPAGFGKTTLVRDWIINCERPAAWLSLDEGDSDPKRFLAYLVAALQTLALSDGDEINNYKTNPNNVDTDNDGLNDNDEVDIYACNRSIAKALKKEGVEIVLMPEVTKDKSARELIPERLEKGWVYIKA